MRTAASFTLLAALALGFAPAPVPKKVPTSEAHLKAMQGKWRRVSLSIDGKPYPEAPGGVFVTIKSDLMAFASPHDTWRVTLDPAKKPGRLDTRRADGGGDPFWGVYRLDGDALTVCCRRGAKESDRPASFDPGQPGVWVQVFRRVKE